MRNIFLDLFTTQETPVNQHASQSSIHDTGHHKDEDYNFSKYFIESEIDIPSCMQCTPAIPSCMQCTPAIPSCMQFTPAVKSKLNILHEGNMTAVTQDLISFMTPDAAGLSNSNFAERPYCEIDDSSPCMSPLNISVTDVDEYINEVMLQTSVTPGNLRFSN